jgi:hypothetical protein
MATCEFHEKYEDYLIDQIAVELVVRGGRRLPDLSEVLCVVKRIAICETLEQITPGEAENLTSVVFKLYPQFEEKIGVELIRQFG